MLNSFFEWFFEGIVWFEMIRFYCSLCILGSVGFEKCCEKVVYGWGEGVLVGVKECGDCFMIWFEIIVKWFEIECWFDCVFGFFDGEIEVEFD